MKKSVIRLFSVVIFSIMLFMGTIVSSSAAETASVNGVKIAVGDTFTYTFNISDAQQKITGMQMTLFFDRDVLELVGVSDGVLDGTSTINDDVEKNGRIVYVNPFMNGGGLECKEETVVATATFKVIKAEKTDITYFVEYLYDIDMADIYPYTFTCDFLSRETVISQGNTPILADKTIRDELIKDDTFHNNEDGKADDLEKDPAPETTYESLTETSAVTASEEASVLESQTSGEERTPFGNSVYEEPETHNNKEKSEDRGEDNNPILLIFSAAGIVLVSLGTVFAIVVIAKKKGKKK